MIRFLISTILLLLCRSAFALSAAQIQENYDRAKVQWTIPEGDHEIEKAILVRSDKTLRMAAGCRLIVRGRHYAIHGDNVKNFTLRLGEIINHCRDNSGYATNVFLYRCTNGKIYGGQVRGGWCGVNLRHCSDLSFVNVEVSDTTESHGWVMAGCKRNRFEYCSAVRCGADGFRSIAGVEDCEWIGCKFNHNGSVLSDAGNGTRGSGIQLTQGGTRCTLRDLECIGNVNVGVMIKSNRDPKELYVDGIAYGTIDGVSIDRAYLAHNGSHGIYVQWNAWENVPQPKDIALTRIHAFDNGDAGIWANANGVSATNSILKRNKDGLILFRTCLDWGESGNVVEKNIGYQKLLPTDYR